MLSSCDSDLSEELFTCNSKIWINTFIKANQPVKIFLGVTSGMNSEKTAEYRVDASVLVYINNSDEYVKLLYNSINNRKGYYFNPDMPVPKPGDSLKFVAWIEGEDLDKVEGTTYIPHPVKIDSVSIRKVKSLKDDKIIVELEIMLDTLTIQDDKYFDLKMKNRLYMDDPNIPVDIISITSKDNLILSKGMSWNESSRSILIDYSLVENNRLSLQCSVPENYKKSTMLIRLKTIPKDYYDFAKAVNDGHVIKSNIKNGTGIFSGYSESKKVVVIK